MCHYSSCHPADTHILGPFLISGLQKQQLGGHHQSPARPTTNAPVEIKRYLILGLELCFFWVMFKDTVHQFAEITSIPRSLMLPLNWTTSKEKTLLISVGEEPSWYICFWQSCGRFSNSAFEYDPKVSPLAYGQWYRLSWVWSLINENIVYRKTASAFARRQTASGILWLLTAGSHECLLSY